MQPCCIHQIPKYPSWQKLTNLLPPKPALESIQIQFCMFFSSWEWPLPLLRIPSIDKKAAKGGMGATVLEITNSIANVLQVWEWNCYTLPVLQPTLCRYRSEGVRHYLFYSQHFAGMGVMGLDITRFTANALQVWDLRCYTLPVLQPTLCRQGGYGVRHYLFYSQHFAGRLQRCWAHGPAPTGVRSSCRCWCTRCGCAHTALSGWYCGTGSTWAWRRRCWWSGHPALSSSPAAWALPSGTLEHRHQVLNIISSATVYHVKHHAFLSSKIHPSFSNLKQSKTIHHYNISSSHIKLSSIHKTRQVSPFETSWFL